MYLVDSSNMRIFELEIASLLLIPVNVIIKKTKKF